MSEIDNSTIAFMNQTIPVVGPVSNEDVYFVPIRIFGVLTNFINIIILRDKKFKDKTFKYLFYYSISEFVYLFFLCILTIPYCGNYCYDSLKYSLISQLLRLYIDQYFTSCLAVFSITIEITISLQRYLIVSNKNFCKMIKDGSPLKISCFLLLLSLLFYLPIAIIEKVKRKYPNKNLYELDMGGEVDQYYTYVTVIIRGPIFTLVLTFINLLTLIKFKEQMYKKTAIKSNTSNILNLY
jgi:hypothetical protein